MSSRKKNSFSQIFKYLCLISLILIGHKFFAQSQSNTTNDKLEEEFKFIVSSLADSSMGGRYAGSTYEIMAFDFLSNYLHDYSETYDIKSDTFSYCCRNDSIVTAHNLWLYPKKSIQKNIFLTAHYDHLPPDSKHSKEIWNKHKIHPGADDNASGVAMAVLLFKYINMHTTNFQPVLILFSGHEEGLHGSECWFKNNLCKNDSIILVANFDMVGRLSEETNIISIRIKDDNVYIYTLQNIKNELHVMLTSDRLNDTDIINFINKNIPSFTVSTGIHSDYHRISDTADKINYKGMVKIFNFMTKFFNLL